MAEIGSRLRANVQRAVKVEDEVVRDVLVALLAEGHVLIEDFPGVGKTALARAIARSIEAEYARVQCTADLLPADLMGTNVFDRRTQVFDFHPGPVFANVVLVDEINRASPKTQSGLLECMQERRVTVDGVPHELARPFLVIATQNPVEYEGTYPLPEAQPTGSWSACNWATPGPRTRLDDDARRGRPRARPATGRRRVNRAGGADRVQLRPRKRCPEALRGRPLRSHARRPATGPRRQPSSRLAALQGCQGSSRARRPRPRAA